MSDKYIDLSIDETLGLLANWRSAATKLQLKLRSIVGVGFTGTVSVGERKENDFPLTIRFDCFSDDGSTKCEAVLMVELLGSQRRRASVEIPRRWLACTFFDPDLRFVLTELTERESLDVDFILESTSLM